MNSFYYVRRKAMKLALALSFAYTANLLSMTFYHLPNTSAKNRSSIELEIELESQYAASKSETDSEISRMQMKNYTDSMQTFQPEQMEPSDHSQQHANFEETTLPPDDNISSLDSKLDDSSSSSMQLDAFNTSLRDNNAQSNQISGSDQVEGGSTDSNSAAEPIPTAVNNSSAEKDAVSEPADDAAPPPMIDVQDLAESVKSPPDGTAKFFLTACTMVKNEVPYIIEWIEFNRLQGVERIIIYEGGSDDNVTYLNELYQQEDPPFPLVVLPSVPFVEDDNLQRLNFQHCLDTYGPSTQWMVNLDVDEFLYSPAFGTVAGMLRNMSLVGRQRNLSFTDFTSVNLNFGSSGQLHRFENRLTRRPDGRAAHENGCGPQLITDHVLRGPAAAAFKEPEASEYRRLTEGLWICELRGFFPPCRHNPGKTVFRPEAVAEAGIHLPRRMRRAGDQINWFRAPLLVGNHYYYRSRADVALKARQWRNGVGLPEHVRNYNLTDRLLWGHTRDEAVRRAWGPELARRVRARTATAGPCLHGAGRGAT